MYHTIPSVVRLIANEVDIPVTLSPFALRNVASDSKEEEGDDCDPHKIDGRNLFIQEERNDLRWDLNLLSDVADRLDSRLKMKKLFLPESFFSRYYNKEREL